METASKDLTAVHEAEHRREPGKIMQRFWETARSFEGQCIAWIAACFSLTSAGYLSWLYHMAGFLSPVRTDVFSMVVGYLFQAAGTGLGMFLLRRKPAAEHRNLYLLSLIGFFLAAVLSSLVRPLWLILLFGFLMNLGCGIIAAFYLAVPVQLLDRNRAKVFGIGYGISTLLIGLLSLVAGGKLLATRSAAIVCFLLALASAFLGMRVFEQTEPAEELSETDRGQKRMGPESLYLVGFTVLLFSLVKNLGFSFPTEDILNGVSIEFSRLFYATGLIAAGILSDHNRRYGAICTFAALAIPFVMLAVQNEPLPRFLCWGLDYLFFGFFSVFRVVLFMDIAREERNRTMAPLGLALGRIGDAAGTAFCIGLAQYRLVLIGLTLVLFILATFFFFRLFHVIYEPEKEKERSEREIFEDFAMQHDLSAREKEVLRLLLGERSNAEIAGTLFVSESTIKYHVHNLLQKTGTKSRQDLIKKYNVMLFPGLGKD